MDLVKLSIKRPVFIVCAFALSVMAGLISFKKIGVDLYPDISVPIVVVGASYPGAGPKEVESQIVKPIEDELSTLAGLKKIESDLSEGTASVRMDFNHGTDMKTVEQQVRERVSTLSAYFPRDAKILYVKAIDPTESPVVTLGVTSDEPAEVLSKWAQDEFKPRLEQVMDVGSVELGGLQNKEISVALNENALKERELSVNAVYQAVSQNGKNVPSGVLEGNNQVTQVRSVGQISSLSDIQNMVLSFFGNEHALKLGALGTVQETVRKDKTRAFMNGKPSITAWVFRRTGANTIRVADDVKATVKKLNESQATRMKGLSILVSQDQSEGIRMNVDDVKESLAIGLMLTILVVFLFLGSARSTFITALAIPNSLLGAFILMDYANFTLNIMTLLAMSLAVGLLVDDAIVVRENIFRHMEMGKSPKVAALEGTKEVSMAVIATTLTVLAVFGPIAFLEGMIGQFFKQFGLTICFALMVSLIDAFTMAPMLSANWKQKINVPKNKTLLGKLKLQTLEKVIQALGIRVSRLLEKFQLGLNKVERLYIKALGRVVIHPKKTIAAAFVIFVLGCASLVWVPKTFIAPRDEGEFDIEVIMAPGTSPDATAEAVLKLDSEIRVKPEVRQTEISVGRKKGGNSAKLYVKLKKEKERKVTTSEFQKKLSSNFDEFMKQYPKSEVSLGSRSKRGRTVDVDVTAKTFEDAKLAAEALLPQLKNIPGTLPGKVNLEKAGEEIQIKIDSVKASQYGVNISQVGNELYSMIDGVEVFKLRKDGDEIPVRVFMEGAKDFTAKDLGQFWVMNLNQKPIQLNKVAKFEVGESAATISRLNRMAMVSVEVPIDETKNLGLGQISNSVEEKYKKNEFKLPAGAGLHFSDSSEDYNELMSNMLKAFGLAIILMFLVLSSLYESFKTPLAIMLVLPLAACGAFLGLWVFNSNLDLFSMIGCVLLMGVSAKNSILLVDAIEQRRKDGKNMIESIMEAGSVRLRPILMTSAALISGMIPVALGFNEVSKYRTSMGISVICGLLSSTILSLLVIPAVYRLLSKKTELTKGLETEDTRVDRAPIWQ